MGVSSAALGGLVARRRLAPAGRGGKAAANVPELTRRDGRWCYRSANRAAGGAATTRAGALSLSIPTDTVSAETDFARPDLIGLAAALALTMVVGWLCAVHPAMLPAWAPWEFSWSQFLAAVLALLWYFRGVALLETTTRPALWRRGLFVLGLGLLYGVLLTHFQYMAQHMFFLNRLQHMVMHHVGPFLIALAWPGAALRRGMPAPLRRWLGWRPLGTVMHWVQQPALAGTLFAGLILLWLVPAIHFRAMIDPQLYAIMNWSMVLDGLLFWCLVLDPRPYPEARSSFAARLLTTILVMFPQILAGSIITFGSTSLYSYYDLCGRLFPSIGALADQHYGGLLVWIPSSMMSAVAFMLIMNNLRLLEDRMPATLDPEDGNDGRIIVSARGWTGR
jgi:putative membrane protein